MQLSWLTDFSFVCDIYLKPTQHSMYLFESFIILFSEIRILSWVTSLREFHNILFLLQFLEKYHRIFYSFSLKCFSSLFLHYKFCCNISVFINCFSVLELIHIQIFSICFSRNLNIIQFFFCFFFKYCLTDV